MDHLIAATIAQNGLDVRRALARDALGILDAIGGKPARNLVESTFWL